MHDRFATGFGQATGLQLLKQPSQRIIGLQQQTLQQIINGHFALTKHFEGVLEAVGGFLDAAQAQHGRTPLDGVGGPEKVINQLGVIETIAKADQPLLEIHQMITRFLNVEAHNPLLRFLIHEGHLVEQPKLC